MTSISLRIKPWRCSGGSPRKTLSNSFSISGVYQLVQTPKPWFRSLKSTKTYSPHSHLPALSPSSKTLGMKGLLNFLKEGVFYYIFAAFFLIVIWLCFTILGWFPLPIVTALAILAIPYAYGRGIERGEENAHAKGHERVEHETRWWAERGCRIVRRVERISDGVLITDAHELE